MKRAKLVFWLIVLALVALVIYQNRLLFQADKEVVLDLGVKTFQGEFSFGLMLLALFVAGLLIAYFFSLTHRYRTRKTIRRLNEELAQERKKQAEMEAKVGHGSGQSATAKASESGPEKGAERPQDKAGSTNTQ
jgi:uncharacterized integral membrane protein